MPYALARKHRYVFVIENQAGELTEEDTSARVRTVRGFARRLGIPLRELSYAEVQEWDGDDYDVVDSHSA